MIKIDSDKNLKKTNRLININIALIALLVVLQVARYAIFSCTSYFTIIATVIDIIFVVIAKKNQKANMRPIPIDKKDNEEK
ncbi:MAG: hypothetical protein RR922_05715 [Clostridia bacterium]